MDLLGIPTALLVTCLIMLLVWTRKDKKKNYPPGPLSLPLVGSLPLLKAKGIVGCLTELSKKYGPVFRVNFGSNPAVVFYGFDVVKKALIDRGDDFLGRGIFPSAYKASKGFGIVMSHGDRWLQLRRFSVTTLKNFGMGKKSNEEHVQEEAECLVEELKAKRGEPFNPTILFCTATANVISRIMLRERFDYHDPKDLRILHFLTEALRLQGSFAGQLSEKYGPVFQISFGTMPAVVLYGYDVVKKALIDRGDEFLDRGKFPSSDKTNKGLGVSMSTGERWLQIRRFSLMTLRNFGMGKKSNEEHVQEEAQCLVEELKAKKGGPFNPASLFSSSTANVISRILLGERFDHRDPRYLRLLNLITETLRLESSFAGQLYNLFPRIMDYLPGPHQTFFKYMNEIQAFIAQKVEDHERTLEPSSPRDFVDDFLLKMEQEKNNPQTEYTRENLIITVSDLFNAGTETTSTTLRYILMLLIEHPEVQAKIHKEIDEVIGRHRPPALKDRLAMPYTEAVIQEAQRFMDFAPLGFVRTTKDDLEFEGFTIRKGTSVIIMLSSALRDPEHFKNPDQFDPNHFLDEKGAFRKNEAAIPFSAGRRNCIGD